ncbi:myelocytomatosis oncogene homolog isoform X2 [Trichomycterus rosablanca]
MLPSCSPPHDWLGESEPLLFDDEFCQNLIKDLQAVPTPPQSPPLNADLSKSMSNVDQLELVSELLLREDDLFHLNWNCDFNVGDRDRSSVSLPDDWLWPGRTEKIAEEKMSVLSTSPLLSDIDTEIFAEIAGSTLDCHSATLACQPKIQSDNLILDSPEQSESSSDYGSLSAAGELSSSDSEEEIDVVTVRRCNTLVRSQRQLQDTKRRMNQLALKRCHIEIQQQHNYAAPLPSSPPPTHSCIKQNRSVPKHLVFRHSCDAEDDSMRRQTHNVMERQRRNELKNCFMRLRDNVPELSNNDKASKVMILKRAKESICNLESEAQRLLKKRDRLQERHQHLKARLEHLKKL